MCHAFERTEPLQVCTPCIVKKCNIGLSHPCQIANFARMIRAHFDDRILLVLQACQGQRYADVVIQISKRRQHITLLFED